jgi:hypothetical protein
MGVTFTAHNIQLDDGSFTHPSIGYRIADHPWMLSAKRFFSPVEGLLFPLRQQET